MLLFTGVRDVVITSRSLSQHAGVIHTRHKHSLNYLCSVSTGKSVRVSQHSLQTLAARPYFMYFIRCSVGIESASHSSTLCTHTAQRRCTASTTLGRRLTSACLLVCMLFACLHVVCLSACCLLVCMSARLLVCMFACLRSVAQLFGCLVV